MIFRWDCCVTRCACCASPQLLAKNTEPIESTSPAEASQRSGDSGADEQQEAEEDAEQDENRAPKRKRKQASEPTRKIKKKPAAAPPGMSVCAMQLLHISAPADRGRQVLKA
jgi:hypothetical protein